MAFYMGKNDRASTVYMEEAMSSKGTDMEWLTVKKTPDGTVRR